MSRVRTQRSTLRKFESLAGLGLVRGLESGLSKVHSLVKVAGDWGTSGCYTAAVNTDSNRAAKLEMPFIFIGSSVSDKACPTS
ncbi:hypothetical protein J6590_091612 [Homalodisca vitripennis]|nr:hypothetical protein J6590_091612 [Homalodisca vitripennis]